MANPQKENGHLRIANELFDEYIRINIPGVARQVLDFIIRKTYGYNKKEDQIATSQFIEATGLSRKAIEKARKKLREMNLITTHLKGGSQTLFYVINKDYETWKLPPKKRVVLSPKKGVNYPLKGTELPPALLINNKQTINNNKQKQAASGASSENPIDNPKVNEALDSVLKAGFNIHAAICKTKAMLHQPVTWRFPDDVILKVCEAYHREKPQIKKPWPWFLSVLKRESSLWFAGQHVDQAQIYKKSGAMNFKEILSQVQKGASNERGHQVIS